MLIIGNIDADGYLKEPPLDELAEEAAVTVGAGRSGARAHPGVRPGRRRRARSSRSAC